MLSTRIRTSWLALGVLAVALVCAAPASAASRAQTAVSSGGALAKITGKPPNLTFKHVGRPSAPPTRTWLQIGSNPDNDDGPLGPYYSIGFAEASGVFYATQQRDWNWSANGPFTGLVGIAYSRNHGKTWSFPKNSFPAPLGNLTFIDGGVAGGADADGYMYAIGTAGGGRVGSKGE